MKQNFSIRILMNCLISVVVLDFINSQLDYIRKPNSNFLRQFKNASKNQTPLDCEFQSTVFSVDTNSGKSAGLYDLLMSYSSNSDCYFTCQITDTNNITTINIISEKYLFSGQYYTMLKFPSLKNGEAYTWNCEKQEIPGFGYNDEIKLVKPIIPIKSISNYPSGSFKFPKHNNSNEHLNILAFGDWSISDVGNYTHSTINKYLNQTDAIIYLGDLAYDLHDNNGENGNKFMKYAKRVMSKTAFQVTSGNHETFNDFEHFKKRFNLPNKDETKNMYYSWDIKDIHFTAINSEITYEHYTPEYILEFTSWLKKDLSSKAKWKIIYMHRPYYTSLGSGTPLRNLIEEIVMNSGVDMVVAGHVHAYERLYPIYNQTVDMESVLNNGSTYNNPKFPVHVICGGAGNTEGMMHYKINPEIAKMMSSEPGICNLEISDNKIEFKFIETKGGKVKDEFELIKNSKGSRMNIEIGTIGTIGEIKNIDKNSKNTDKLLEINKAIVNEAAIKMTQIQSQEQIKLMNIPMFRSGKNNNLKK